MPRVQRVKLEGRGVNSISPERRRVKWNGLRQRHYMIGLSTNTPFRFHLRSTHRTTRPHENSYVTFSVKKTDATILGHHIGSLRCIAGSAWAVVIYDNGCSVPFAVRPVTWIGDYQRTICDDIPISPEVIDVHTLNFKPNFKFSRLKFFGGPPSQLGYSLYILVNLYWPRLLTIDYQRTGQLDGSVV